MAGCRRKMEMPEHQKRRDNEDFIPRRLLCATENPATGNEMIPLPDLKEPLNLSVCNAGKSPSGSLRFFGFLFALVAASVFFLAVRI